MLFGCSMLKKEKKTETPISVETPPAEKPAETPTETPETAPPAGPVYTPANLDNLKMLAATLYASAETLGWDNVFCSITLDKDLELFRTIQPNYTAGTSDRSFIDASITDLTNIQTWLDEKISKAEGVDPTGADAKAKKAKIMAIRDRVLGMISGPAPKKTVGEAKGDAMKKKWKEGGDLKKKKWAEGHK
jgi:hypothetical protein